MAKFPEPPNRRSIVEQLFASGRFDITTTEGCGRLSEAAVPEFNKRDPGEWFLLKKGGNNYNGHSVDGAVHAPTGYFVDFIGSSAHEDAEITWHLDRVKKDDAKKGLKKDGPRYKGQTHLFMPAPAVEPEPEPEPKPDPKPATLEGRVAVLESHVDALLNIIRALREALASRA